MQSVCAGMSNNGDVGPDCGTVYNGESYYYMEPGICNDGQESDSSMPDFEWSYEACLTSSRNDDSGESDGGNGITKGIVYTIPLVPPRGRHLGRHMVLAETRLWWTSGGANMGGVDTPRLEKIYYVT